MLLKVGELARRTGLTVRTLHHYDQIGLLAPTGRSEAGYRLYGRDDVARLYGIQALQHLGLSLKDITALLAGEVTSPDLILEQQVRALDQEIARATELRARLALIQNRLVMGAQPDMADWLETLALMTTYGKYFSAAELKRIFENWKPLEAEWTPLKAEVRALMDRGVAADALEVQPLANRWIALMLHWMGGDMDLLERWSTMFRNEATAHGRNSAPEGDMIDFISRAIDLRKGLLLKYLPMEEVSQFARVPHADWLVLEARVQALIAAGAAPAGQGAQAALQAWNALIDHLVHGDAAVRERLLQAWAAEPVLQAGSALSAPVRAYLQQARQQNA